MRPRLRMGHLRKQYRGWTPEIRPGAVIVANAIVAPAALGGHSPLDLWASSERGFAYSITFLHLDALSISRSTPRQPARQQTRPSSGAKVIRQLAKPSTIPCSFPSRRRGHSGRLQARLWFGPSSLPALSSRWATCRKLVPVARRDPCRLHRMNSKKREDHDASTINSTF